MKIFITIPWFLPAYRAGGPVQSIANLVEHYREGVTYYIFCGDVDVNGAALEVVTGNWLDYNPHTKVWYAAPQKISDALVKQTEVIKPDILFIVGMFSWHYNIVPLIYGKAGKKILSSRGMLHPGALAQKKWKKRIFLELFRLFEYQYKVVFHATDAAEAQFIQEYFGEKSMVHIAGNFPNEIGALPRMYKEKGALKLASIGLISPMKNILAVLQSLAMVQGEVQYDIYGAIKDEDYWDSCRRQIETLPQNIKVIAHREIEPCRVAEALQQTHVFILPSESENFGHALYEALSAGRPVITSHRTPWNHLQVASAGINVSPGDHDGVAAAINTFISMDDDTFAAWHTGALQYAAAATDRPLLTEQYRQLFQIELNGADMATIKTNDTI